MIIRILAISLNWNVERPDDDPARRSADAVADRQRQHEQAELEGVDRPGEGLQPVVVEDGRDDEDDDRDRRPTSGRALKVVPASSGADPSSTLFV